MLPDRHPALDRVHKRTAYLKGVVSVSGTRRNDDRHLTHGEVTHAMRDRDSTPGPGATHFDRNRERSIRGGGMAGVAQAGDTAPGVVITNLTDEDGDRARGVVAHGVHDFVD